MQAYDKATTCRVKNKENHRDIDLYHDVLSHLTMRSFVLLARLQYEHLSRNHNLTMLRCVYGWTEEQRDEVDCTIHFLCTS